MRNITILNLLFLLLISCAQQTSPTGGPKDEDPPLLIQSSPNSNQKNFKGKEIKLEFNKDVILNNPKEQLIITPDIGNDYEITVKKNRVVLTIDKPLLDSTTYAFNFGESVQDITEKNPAENLHLAFSTGDIIDSLQISGTVKSLLTGKTLEKIVVAIYPVIQPDTFNIFKHKPSYISRTKKDGTYLISNLKHGTYFIYAYHDKNRNLVVDSKSEQYGFLTKHINLEKDTTNIDLTISPMDMTELKVTRARPFNNYYTINLSKNIVDYTLTLANKSDTLTSTFGENNANIITYNTIPHNDSLQVNLNAFDSVGFQLDTTFFIKYAQREVTPEKFTISNLYANVYTDEGKIETKYSYNKPITTTNLDSLYIYIDSTTQIHLSKQDFTFDLKKQTLTINKKFDKKLLEPPTSTTSKPLLSEEDVMAIKERKTSPTLQERANQAIAQAQNKKPTNFIYQGKGAFISIDNDSSGATNHALKLLKNTDMAVFLIEVSTEEQFILNILNKDYKIVRSIITTNKSIKVENLLPDQYQLQLIIDTNKNGKWDAGNIFEKREPEPIRYYIYENETPLVPAKANWEVGPLLITY